MPGKQYICVAADICRSKLGKCLHKDMHDFRGDDCVEFPCERDDRPFERCVCVPYTEESKDINIREVI